MSKKVFSNTHAFGAGSDDEYDSACDKFIEKMTCIGAYPLFTSGRFPVNLVRMDYCVPSGSRIYRDASEGSDGGSKYDTEGDISVVVNCDYIRKTLEFSVASRVDEKGVDVVHEMLAFYFRES